MWYASSCRGTIARIGWRSQSVRGIETVSSASTRVPSVVTAITWAPRARTSAMFEATFSSTGESVATQTTGVCSSSRAIGPCFLSPAVQAGQLEREELHHRHLRHERLGRRHADLEAGAREDHAVRVTCGLTA